ncbi:hypothetical protein HHI36_014583 [Cryptolaemus montrouzieri]|uniref:SWI/SNF-related matrix-associated actin-dependent regulator of chromatin subfamily A-like protein 1 n=1 Tax=Cryptolaemus montrouzieri TaxID=559131 RepID=A0ABD2N3C8_9CUCU
MQCTAEEIERKRQQALQILASKNKSPLKCVSAAQNSYSALPVTPNRQFKFHKSNTNTNFKSYQANNGKDNSKPITQYLDKQTSITAKCVVTSNVKFTVELSAFSTPAIEVFKSIPSRQYDANTKQWSFQLQEYEIVLAKLNALKGHLDVVKIPQFVLKCLRSPVHDLSKIDLSPIEPELRNSLMPFQREGVAYGIDKGGRCLIADDMGLGKTFQALGIASYYRKEWPLLIVTTASMKNTWEETIRQYLPSISLMHLQYMVSTKDFINDAKVLILSHDMLTRAVDKLIEKKFGVLILMNLILLKILKQKVLKQQ